MLPKLPYSYDALEPHIDARTMEIHHTKHHQTYTDKLNAALEHHPDIATRTIENILANLTTVPEDIRTAVRNHGGGYANHNLLWTVMAPKSGGISMGKLTEAINQEFESFEKFREQFTQTATSLFGSGWTWLAMDVDGGLMVMTTPNQDTPLSQGLTPILGLDVWEHAYYLKYQNRRPDYIQAWWNIVNWQEVSRRYEAAQR